MQAAVDEDCPLNIGMRKVYEERRLDWLASSCRYTQGKNTDLETDELVV